MKSILISTLHCICAGFVTGALASAVLVLLVLLLSETVQVTAMDARATLQTIALKDPADVQPGIFSFSD